MKYLLSFIVAALFFSCNKETPDENDVNTYFPPVDSELWEEIPIEDLAWNTEAENALYEFLEANDTRAFIILEDGKIATEKYWGKTLTGLNDFDKDKVWYWASAGKTVTATVTGIAQEEGFLDINDSTSEYLGQGWTSATTDKESLIKIKDQLCMTSGLDFDVDLGCTDSECLKYKVDAGDQWYYHNGPYTLLQSVITNATGKAFEDYTSEKLFTPIGVDVSWIPSGYNNVLYSTAREMARFGLLIQNKGKWNESQIIPSNYYNEMINTSQSLNPSYGYLWWLNGKSSIRYPGLDLSINATLAPDAPNDLFAAMGKNGQFVDIDPSNNRVVIRMGQAPNDDLVPVEFHNEMWKLINEL